MTTRPPDVSPGGREVLRSLCGLRVLGAALGAVGRRVLVRVPRRSGVDVVLVATAHTRLVLRARGVAIAAATGGSDAARRGPADEQRGERQRHDSRSQGSSFPSEG